MAVCCICDCAHRGPAPSLDLAATTADPRSRGWSDEPGKHSSATQERSATETIRRRLFRWSPRLCTYVTVPSRLHQALAHTPPIPFGSGLGTHTPHGDREPGGLTLAGRRSLLFSSENVGYTTGDLTRRPPGHQSLLEWVGGRLKVVRRTIASPFVSKRTEPGRRANSRPWMSRGLFVSGCSRVPR